MPNSTSKIAEELNDQYFTPVDTAKWCFEEINRATGWEFKGTALEPSVGGFAFVRAAEQLGLDLEWTTNDLFPQPGRKPDFQQDFKEFEFGVYNYVITNPPFGKSNSLAKTFMKRSFNLAPRVMMLLPKGCRRIGFQDSMPQMAWRKHDSELPSQLFELSNGETRIVKTCVQAWQVDSKSRPKVKDTLDLREDLVSHWQSVGDSWDKDMNAQIVRWGRMGAVLPKEKWHKAGSLMSIRFGEGMTTEHFESICATLDFQEYEDMCSTVPAFDPPIWHHRFNTEAVRRGLLSPL